MKKKALLLFSLLLAAALFAISCGGDVTTAPETEPPKPTVMFNGTIASDYRIIYENANESVRLEAVRLADELEARHGISIACESDTADPTPHEILVGSTNRNEDSKFGVGEYGYLYDGGKICVGGHSNNAPALAVDKFLADLAAFLEGKRGGRVDMVFTESINTHDVTALRIMSFNIKVGDITLARQKGVINTIKACAPDLIGMQEANGTWMDYLNAQLSDDYGSVFRGREGSASSEGTPVFYNKHKFELVSSGTKWLSDRPDLPTKVDSSICLRVMTYTELRVIDTDERIIFVSTHLDHSGDATTVHQAKYMHEILVDLFGEDVPIFIVGDFNVNQTSETVSYMTSEFKMKSASHNKFIQDDSPTFNGSKNPSKIDYCFYFEKYAEPSEYKVITDKHYNIYPSDHFAIYADFYLK